MPIRTAGPNEAIELGMRRPIIETPMPSGANSIKGGPVVVDPSVPEELRRPAAVHETVEEELMKQGYPYSHAHEVATQAEKSVVERMGMNWEEYTHRWDGVLDHTEHEKVSELPAGLHVDPEAAIGHHRAANKEVRAVPIMQTRALAVRLAEEAQAAGRETAAVPQPELPFEASAAVARMRGADEVLAGGVQQVARRAGYDMPDAEAAQVAARLVKATPEEADSLLRDLQVNPRTMAAEPQKSPLVSPAAKGPEVPVSPVTESTLASPQFDAALRADIDRERMTKDVQIPVDVDKDGNPIHRSLDAAMDEVDAYKAAAEQIAACAAPQPEPAEQEAA